MVKLPVSLDVIGRICKSLNVKIEDVIEIILMEIVMTKMGILKLARLGKNCYKVG